MITTEIYKGQGLGNQLWCYVVTRVIAKDKGYKFGIQSPEKLKCLDFLNLDFGEKVIDGAGPEGGTPHVLPEGIKYYYNERKILHPNGTDIRTYDENLVSIPDNTKIDGIMQDEQYILHRKSEIHEWLEVKTEYVCLDYSNENTCIINFRGGEYTGFPELFLTKKYWDDAITHMRKINSNMRFVVVTDDVKTAKKFFPGFEVTHFSIGKDYSIINHAYYLILSNSSFAWFPAWLNAKVKLVIAPKYWARHNVSDGYWGCSYNITSGWMYQDINGTLYDYNSCINEHNEYKTKHSVLFKQVKIESNFLVVSNYYNDLSWVPEYTNNYIIYDQSDATIIPPKLDQSKIIKSAHLGHNIRDYCSYIIDNYDKLPARIAFVTGNIFPRHVTRDCFDNLINNDTFTPFIDKRKHSTKWPISFLSSDGGYNEINDSWYLNTKNNAHPTKYFHNYNDFMRFCFKNPAIPKYIKFAPGANYIVPKENILKFPKIFYENLRTFVSHCPTAIPGESHIIERAFYTIWTTDLKVNKNMLSLVRNDFVASKKTKPAIFYRILILIINRFWTIGKIGKKIFKETRNLSLFSSYVSTVLLNFFLKFKKKQTEYYSSQEFAELRKKIKICDIFIYNGEEDLLEIRLNILNDTVDEFIIVEAPTTFSGNPKTLYFEKQKERFAPFLHKIKYFVIDDYPNDPEILKTADSSPNVPKNGPEHWRREFYQKESIKKALTHLKDEDICFVGDVDEIWKLTQGMPKDIGKYKLSQLVYVYYLNNRSNEPWTGTLLTNYKIIKEGCLNHLRTDKKWTVLEKGGWHFTSMGGIQEVKRKLNDSYTEESYNNKQIQKKLSERFGQKDYMGRKFKFWTDESDLPEYILINKEKYKHLFKPENE